MTETKSDPRSVSQRNEYRKCPHAYYLHRKRKAWEKPAAWLAQGTGVHKAAEEWELSGRSMTPDEAEKVFKTAYAEVINAALLDTPNGDFWYASGPYQGFRDIERRYGIGLQQVGRVLDYLESQVSWSHANKTSGKPAVELEMDIAYGDVPVRGYIDRVDLVDCDVLKVVDIKTGNNPGDDFQLAVYADYIEQTYHEQVSHGEYLMAGKNGVKKAKAIPFDLKTWDHDSIGEEFEWIDAGIREERFDPQPEESKCRFCSVASACEFSLA